MKKILPVCIFTKNRTMVACATIEALLSKLTADGYKMHYIVCDDRSKPGHLGAIKSVFDRFGEKPTVLVNDSKRWGLGASMNNGLEAAFNMSDVCLRMEDDWMLDRPLDIGSWASCMDELSIGSIRLGMMFRNEYELKKFGNGLLRLSSDSNRRYNFNNQIALVTRACYDLCGKYLENAFPQDVERDMADKFNQETHFGVLSPWVCWPEGWARKKYYDKTLPFVHIGRSSIGHNYQIPFRYHDLNNPEFDEKLRAKYA